MHTYLAYHWTIFDSFKSWLDQQVLWAGQTRFPKELRSFFSFLNVQIEAGRVNVSEPLLMIDTSRFEMVNSKYAMTSISNILMNLIVLEPEFVEESVTFFHILKFIMNSLPLLVNDGKSDISTVVTTWEVIHSGWLI